MTKCTVKGKYEPQAHLEQGKCVLNTYEEKDKNKPQTYTKQGQVLLKTYTEKVEDELSAEIAKGIEEIQKVSKTGKQELEVYDKQAFKETKGSVDINTDKKDDRLSKEFKDELVRFYNEKESMIPASPLVEDQAVPLKELYVQPQMLAFIKRNAFGQRQEPSEKAPVSSYRELFLNDDNVPYKYIYVEANAGYGKTSFTQMVALTWCLAQNTNNSKITKKQQEDIDTLKSFDLLFLLHLRDFHGDDTCLLGDLILTFVSKNLQRKEKFSKEFIGRMLQNKTCLVILDGLDEWVHPETCLRIPGIPHNNYCERCTQLTTTRPWKLSTIGLTPNLIDRHIEISMLDDKTSEELKSNAVKILSDNSGEKGRDLTDFDRKLFSVKLGDISLFPYILIQLICIWFDGLSIGKSKCESYSNTIELTLQRGLNKKNAPTLPYGNAERNITVPECMRHNELCKRYGYLLLKLGKLAFYTLFQEIEESSLLIESRNVLEFLTEQELEFCLKIGLLSQSKDSSKVSVKRYQVSFQHKSIQEFMAALYITSEWNKGTIQSTIRKVRSSLSCTLDMENLFVFVCGMNPEVYNFISGVLQMIVDLHSSIRQCMTDTFFEFDDEAWKTMKSYQSMQLECLQESLRNGNDSCPIPLYFGLDTHSLTYDVKALKSIMQVNECIGKSPEVSLNEKIVAAMLSDYPPFVFMQSLNPGEYTSLKTLTVEDFDEEPVWLADILNESARTLKCLTLSLEYPSSSLSDISITAITGLTCLHSLYLDVVLMTHSNLKCLSAYISQTTTLTQLKLEDINCSDHDDQLHRDCDVAFDLQLLKKLKVLHLCDIPCTELLFNPAFLEKLEFLPPEGEKITATASAKLWQGLREAPILSSLTLWRITSCQEMIQTIPTLTQLQYLELAEIDMGDVIPRVSPAMTHLELVVLDHVTMSSVAWRKLFLSISQLPRSITVKLSLITMKAQEWKELLSIVDCLTHPLTIELYSCRGPSMYEWRTNINITESMPTLTRIRYLSSVRSGDASMTLEKESQKVQAQHQQRAKRVQVYETGKWPSKIHKSDRLELKEIMKQLVSEPDLKKIMEDDTEFGPVHMDLHATGGRNSRELLSKGTDWLEKIKVCLKYMKLENDIVKVERLAKRLQGESTSIKEINKIENHWDYCIANKNLIGILNLLQKENYPNQIHLKHLCKQVGRKHPVTRIVCSSICDYIKCKCPKFNYNNIWPAYKVTGEEDTTDAPDVIFVINGNNVEKIDFPELNIKIEHRNMKTPDRENEACLDYELDKEIELSAKEMDRLGIAINKNLKDLQRNHSNLIMVSASPIKSVGYKHGKPKEHLMKITPCIVLFVHFKGLIPLQENRFQNCLDGVETDVREGYCEFGAGGGPCEKHDDLKMGVSIGFQNEDTLFYSSGETLQININNFEQYSKNRIVKYGAASSLTSGKLRNIKTATIYSGMIFNNQLEITKFRRDDINSFAAFGDSGSLVFMKKDNGDLVAIGLLMAVTNGTAIANPIHDVLEAFACGNVSLKKFLPRQ